MPPRGNAETLWDGSAAGSTDGFSEVMTHSWPMISSIANDLKWFVMVILCYIDGDGVAGWYGSIDGL